MKTKIGKLNTSEKKIANWKTTNDDPNSFVQMASMAKVNMALTNDKGEDIKNINGDDVSNSSSSSSSSSDSEDDTDT